MKKAKGFTLVELVIVIIIVGILSIIAVPIYRGYSRRSMGTEGKALLGAIHIAQKAYYTEFAEFAVINPATNFSTIVDIDARSNKYFTNFQVSASGDYWTAITSGSGKASGITITIEGSRTGQASWADEGLND